jgi:large subunit ribosomal protein L17
MRHKKSGRKLKRTSSHRKATLNALCTALLRHKKIKTTIAKAKETRMVVEKIITRAKNAVAAEGDKKNVHARRQVARYINDRDVVKELFTEIAPKVASRAGGYTRVVKLGQRFGDGAEVAILELVDFQTGEASKASTKQEKSQKSPKKKQPKKSESAEAEAAK